MMIFFKTIEEQNHDIHRNVWFDKLTGMSETHSTAILSRPQFGDIIPNSNNSYNNRLISFEMMYEDSCFSAATYFFSQTGKIRRSKCSSMSSRLWFLMASGRRWLAIPPACCRGGEGRERLSGRATLYIRERRSEHKKRLPPTSKARATSRALGHF